MKLQSFLLPALAGIATANAEEQFQNAEVYIIKQQETEVSNPPSIPQGLAEAILLQRLSTSEKPSTLGQLPESISQDESVLYLNQYAKAPRPLFEEIDANEPRQLVIAFSGVTTEKQKDLQAALPGVPLAFTAPGLSRLSLEGKKASCAFDQFINPENGKCWKGKTQYLEYNAAKDKNIIKQLGQNIATLQSRAKSGTLETTILLLADPSSSSLLRRDGFEDELVMAEVVPNEDIPTADSSFNADGSKKPSDPSKPFHAFSSKPSGLAARPAILPSCFASHNACVAATDSCSGHGDCVDKWGSIEGLEKSCFFCRCMSTNETDDKGRTGLYHWGGSACHKRDISTPFWLFAGVTLALVGTVAFAIGLLFSVGEEKLPGVIGAGVSRAGK